MNDTYSIVRSKRRTLALQVKPDGQVLVRAPMGLSQSRIKQFVTDHLDWIQKQLLWQAQRSAAYPEPDDGEKIRLQQLAKTCLPEKVAYYSVQMGLRPAGVKITSARTRFGSCSAKNSLCFSWRLMAYPDAAVDYVVVHELAHILHKNHGVKFYACIAAILPDYKERIRLLRPE